MPLPTDPQLTRYEHGSGALLEEDQILAEVRYHLVFPERAAHLTPRADQAPAVLQAFLRGAALALRLADGRAVPMKLTEQHISGMWSATIEALP